MFITTPQRGSALIISLVILTAITLGAIVAMQRSTLQVRMVGNMQHQQKVFNAAYSNLGGLMEQFRKESGLTVILNDAVDAYHMNPNGPGINPYATAYGLTKPAIPENVSTVDNKLIAFEPPSANKNATSLKEMEGSSAATLVPYYFSSTAEASDNAGTTSKQQIGMYYLAPAPNQ